MLSDVAAPCTLEPLFPPAALVILSGGRRALPRLLAAPPDRTHLCRARAPHRSLPPSQAVPARPPQAPPTPACTRTRTQVHAHMSAHKPPHSSVCCCSNLADNRLSGSLPHQLFDTHKLLAVADLSGNAFTGALPDAWAAAKVGGDAGALWVPCERPGDPESPGPRDLGTRPGQQDQHPCPCSACWA